MPPISRLTQSTASGWSRGFSPLQSSQGPTDQVPCWTIHSPPGKFRGSGEVSWLPAARIGEGDRPTSGHCGPRWGWLRAGCCRGDSLNEPVLARLVQSKDKKTSPQHKHGWQRVRSASVCVRPGYRFLAPLVVCSRFPSLLPLRRGEPGSPGGPKNPHPDLPAPGSSELCAGQAPGLPSKEC